MYYIFLFHSHQKSKIKQKQGRSEDKVSREITSMSCTCIFFSFYFSFSCGIVPPYINTKNLKEVAYLISLLLQSQACSGACIVFCLQSSLFAFFLDIKSLLFYIFLKLEIPQSVFTNMRCLKFQFCELRLAPTGRINLVRNLDTIFSVYIYLSILSYETLRYCLHFFHYYQNEHL